MASLGAWLCAFGAKVFMDAHEPVTLEEGDRYPLAPPTINIRMNVVHIRILVQSPIPGEISVLVDGQEIWQGTNGNRPIDIKYPHAASRTPHDFVLRLSGKRRWLDSLKGEALEAATQASYRLDELRFDGVNIWPLIYRTAGYHHDFNGFGDATRDCLDRDLGCDGELRFRFLTPMSTWMVEEYPHGNFVWSDT